MWTRSEAASPSASHVRAHLAGVPGCGDYQVVVRPFRWRKRPRISGETDFHSASDHARDTGPFVPNVPMSAQDVHLLHVAELPALDWPEILKVRGATSSASVERGSSSRDWQMSNVLQVARASGSSFRMTHGL